MASITAAPQRVIRLTLAAGASGTYTIPYADLFSQAIVQVVSGNVGLDVIDLDASLTPADATTHFLVGEDIAGAVGGSPQLTGPGQLFYTKGIPLPLVLTYSINAAGPAGIIIRLYDDVYQGTQTRSL